MEHSDPLERATQPRDRGDTWTDEQFREARERDLQERTAAISSAVVAALGCLLLAALLTSGKIVEIAERQEFGGARDRNVAAAEGLDRVSNFLSLNRPYDAIVDLRDLGEDAGERVDTIEEVAATTTTAAPTTSTTVAAATTTTTTVPEPVREVSETDPLRVYVAGDSQAEYLGQAITAESGWPLEVVIDDRISTSLARPDYFNWPAHIAAEVVPSAPEVVVLFIGANDHQDMEDAAGDRLVEGSESWRAEWQHRLALTFDLLTADDTLVVWVTQPPMRDGALDSGIEVINELAMALVDDRETVVAIDAWSLFGGEGGYADRVTAPSGETIDARVDDGVHLTRAGASLVADLIFAELADGWTFPEG